MSSPSTKYLCPKKEKKGKEPVLDAQLREVVYMYTKTENSLNENPLVFQVFFVH